MRLLIVKALGVLVASLGLVSAAFAQRGVGDQSGVAGQPVKPEVVSLSGTILEVKTGPCESTTGHSLTGTHVILETAQKERLNVHLGPAEAVADTVAKLSAGQALTVNAFRTEKMKENDYVAQSLAFGKTTVELRDAALRPVWAGGNAGLRGTVAGQAGLGRGRGPGWGRGGQRWSAPPPSRPDVPKERAGKIAVTAVAPSLDAAVDPRFGRCPYFILVDMEGETFEALKNTNTSGGNAGGQAAGMIAAKGAKVLLTGKCGPSASESLAAAGIQVAPGCSGTVRAVVEQFKTGQLQPAGKRTTTPESASGKQSATRNQAGRE